MHFYATERTALFIDGVHLHATVKALAFEIDFKRLREYFRVRARLVRALYYTVIAADQEFCSVRPLVDWLDYNGYTLVTKPAKEFMDPEGRRRVKGTIAVELAVDALRLAGELDHVVLFSGDGDFRTLVVALQETGKRVSVVSSLQTQPAMIADTLRRQADQFIDLANLEQIIARDPAVRATSTSVSRPSR